MVGSGPATTLEDAARALTGTGQDEIVVVDAAARPVGRITLQPVATAMVTPVTFGNAAESGSLNGEDVRPAPALAANYGFRLPSLRNIS